MTETKKDGDNELNTDDETYHHDAANLPQRGEHDSDTLNEQKVGEYWRENIRLLVKLLLVWFIVSFGFGILLVDFLNEFSFFGMKLGFWFAQQGAIYVFIILIFTYVVRINQIERRFGIDDTEDVSSDTNNNKK